MGVLLTGSRAARALVLPYLKDSSLQHDPSGVHVAVQHPVAPEALELPYVQGNGVECPAEVALLGGIRCGNFLKPSSALRGLVFRERHELAPASVMDRLRERVVSCHVPDSQVFEHHQIMRLHQSGAELVVEIAPLIRDPGVLDGQQASCLLPVLRPFLLTAEFPLEMLQPLLGFPQELRWFDLLTITGRDQSLQP